MKKTAITVHIVYRYADGQHQWQFRIVNNGVPVLRSCRTYTRRDSAIRAAKHHIAAIVRCHKNIVYKNVIFD